MNFNNLDRAEAVDILYKDGPLALASYCILRGIKKAEFIQEFRQSVKVYEKEQGRETGCHYVAGDAYDKAYATDGMSLYYRYLHKRKESPWFYPMRAVDALRAIRHEDNLASWKAIHELPGYVCGEDLHTVEREDGYTIKLSAVHDNFPFHEDIKCQGYVINWEESRNAGCPEFYNEHGAYWQREAGGEDIEFCIPFTADRDWFYAIGYFPWHLTQYYIPGGAARHDAYLARLRAAIEVSERDIKHFLQSERYCAGVQVFNPDGEEVFSEYLGGCVGEYIETLEVFYEYKMLEQAKYAIEHDKAMIMPEAQPANFCHAYAI